VRFLRLSLRPSTMANKMTFGCNTELVFVAIMLVMFLAFNIGLNYYDNWVLSPGPYPGGLGFPAPLVYSLCHAVSSLIGSIAMIYGRDGNRVTIKMFWAHKIKIVLNSLFLVASILLAWFMVTHASVAIINVLRGSVAIPVLLFAFMFEGKRYSIPKIFAILLIVAASVMSVPWTTFSSTPAGLWLTILATFCVAGKATVSSMLMKNAHTDGMTPLVVLFFDSCFSSLFLLIACLFAGETIRLSQYSPGEPATIGLAMAVGSILAFPYNFITYKFIQMTSAIGWAIATSFKLFIIIVIPMIFYDHTTWVGSYVGLVLFVIGVCFYGMLEAKYESTWLTEVLPKSLSAAEIGKRADPDGTTAGEQTPLNKAQDNLNKFTDAAEVKKHLPKSWMAM